MSNLKPQVVDMLLNIRERQVKLTSPDPYQMSFALFGRDESARDQFFDYILNYQYFGQPPKRRPKFIEYNGSHMQRNYEIQIHNVKENFKPADMHEINPLAAIFCCDADDQQSLLYVSARAEQIYQALNQVCLKNQPNCTTVQTVGDLFNKWEQQEAKPTVLILMKKSQSTRLSAAAEFRTQILQKDFRLQEIEEFDEQCIQSLLVVATSLAESYSRDFFARWRAIGQEGGGCQAM